MSPSFLTRCFALLLCATAPACADAAVWCVDSGAELAQHLQILSNNGVDDEIRIRHGIYQHQPAGEVAMYQAQISGSESLVVSGGWDGANGQCQQQSRTPGATLFDGQLLRAGFVLRTAAGASGSITIENLSVWRAKRFNEVGEDSGAGISLLGPAGSLASVVVDRVLLYGNEAAKYAAGLRIAGEFDRVTVRNSVIAFNQAEDHAAASIATEGDLYVLNNTLRGNLSLVGNTAGMRINALGATFVINNVFSGHLSPDLFRQDLFMSGSGWVARNRFDLITAVDAALNGNTDTDPRFVSANEMRLRPDSPLRNAGTIGVFGGDIGARDMALQPRIQGVAPEIGAYEIDELFGNGFE